MGNANCGTQLKLSAILTGIVATLVAYQFIKSNKLFKAKWLYILGNCSFGIYFSHLAVMWALEHIPYYMQLVYYPFNAIITVVISLACILVGKKVLGKSAKYLAL